MRGPSNSSFASRFTALAAERGPFCLNLDPSPELLRAFGEKDDIWGLRAFCNRVIDAANRRLALIKPQAAYFERFGAAGFEVLADIIGSIHAVGSLALLDGKRGDIGSTNRGYAEGMLGPDSAMGADAVTVHAYLGFGALSPILERAHALDCAVFPVVLSSNPEGRALQAARLPSGLSVAEALAEEITAYNLAHDAAPIGPVGAVVGVTAEQAPAVVARLPHSLILVPGIGAQGGSYRELAQRFGPAAGRTIPCAGRSVLSHGPDTAALSRAIEAQQNEARAALDRSAL